LVDASYVEADCVEGDDELRRGSLIIMPPRPAVSEPQADRIQSSGAALPSCGNWRCSEIPECRRSTAKPLAQRTHVLDDRYPDHPFTRRSAVWFLHTRVGHRLPVLGGLLRLRSNRSRVTTWTCSGLLLLTANPTQASGPRSQLDRTNRHVPRCKGSPLIYRAGPFILQCRRRTTCTNRWVTR